MCVHLCMQNPTAGPKHAVVFFSHHNRVIPSWKHFCVNFISPLSTASVSSPHPGVLCLTKTIKIPLNLGKEPLGAEIKWIAACSLSCCTDKSEFVEIKCKTLNLEKIKSIFLYMKHFTSKLMNNCYQQGS